MNFLKRELINFSYFKYTLPIKNYYLIQWLPKARTNIHDHDGKQCNFMVLNGPLYECRYKDKSIDSLQSSQAIKQFQMNSINDSEGYHQIFNFDNKIKYSIHRYV